MTVAHSEPVEVRSKFQYDHWARGFEVAEIVRRHEHDYFRLRRRSDGVVLPALFPADDVRRAPRG